VGDLVGRWAFLFDPGHLGQDRLAFVLQGIHPCLQDGIQGHDTLLDGLVKIVQASSLVASVNQRPNSSS
jgi:hypothetical protein